MTLEHTFGFLGGRAGSFSAVGAEEKNIETPQELLDLLERGEEYKRYGATGTNSLDIGKFSRYWEIL